LGLAKIRAATLFSQGHICSVHLVGKMDPPWHLLHPLAKYEPIFDKSYYTLILSIVHSKAITYPFRKHLLYITKLLVGMLGRRGLQ